jgi:hypothetical protein
MVNWLEMNNMNLKNYFADHINFYPDFSVNSNYTLYGSVGGYPNVSANKINLVNAVSLDAVGHFRTNATYDWSRSFSIEFKLDITGGTTSSSSPPYLGFSVQLLNANTIGSNVGAPPGPSDSPFAASLGYQGGGYLYNGLSSGGVAILGYNINWDFRYWSYYWIDWNSPSNTVSVYESATATKPGSSFFTFNLENPPISGSYFLDISAGNSTTVYADVVLSYVRARYNIP